MAARISRYATSVARSIREMDAGYRSKDRGLGSETTGRIMSLRGLAAVFVIYGAVMLVLFALVIKFQ